MPPPGGAPPEGGDSRGWLIALGVGLVIAVGLLVFVLATGGDDDNAATTTTAPPIPTQTVIERTVTDRVETQVQTVTTPAQTVTTPAQTVTVQRTATVGPQGGATAP